MIPNIILITTIFLALHHKIGVSNFPEYHCKIVIYSMLANTNLLPFMYSTFMGHIT